MSTNARRLFPLIHEGMDFDEAMAIARRLGRRIGVTISFTDSKIHFEAKVDRDTGSAHVVGVTAYDKPATVTRMS